MTITISLWIIPLIITVGFYIYWTYIFDDGGGYLSGLGNAMGYFMIGLPVSLASWLVWALFFK